MVEVELPSNPSSLNICLQSIPTRCHWMNQLEFETETLEVELTSTATPDV